MQQVFYDATIELSSRYYPTPAQASLKVPNIQDFKRFQDNIIFRNMIFLKWNKAFTSITIQFLFFYGLNSLTNPCMKDESLKNNL